MLCLIGIQPAWASQQTLSSQEEQLQEWITYYYLHNDVSEVGDFLKRIQDSQVLKNPVGPGLSILGFLSTIFSDNPEQVQAWVKDTNFTGITKTAVEYALQLSGNGKIVTDVFQEAPESVSSTPVCLPDSVLKTPEDINVMWGAFYASGRELWVKKIIDVLDDEVPLTGDKTRDAQTRAFAEGTLGSNVMLHELVNRIIHQEINKRSGIVKTKLEEVLAYNEKMITVFPNRDGEFSAMLLIIDPKSAQQEFAKPFREQMHFEQVSKAMRSDMVTTKIVFSGMELATDLTSDVTYDMKILAPDGEVYDNADLKELEARKGKTPHRFTVFDNRAGINLRFVTKG